MYFLLHTVAFLFLTTYAFRLMISKPSYVKLSKKEKVLLTGREKFLLFTLVTGMFQVGSFSSLRLMLWMVMMMAAFILYRRSPSFNRLNIIYILFLIWLLITTAWAPSSEYALRVFLKYFYPLITLLFAATFVHTKEFIFVAVKWMLISAFLYSIFLGGVMTHILGIWVFYMGGMFWPMSTLNDYLSIMSAVSFVMWWRTKEKKYLFLIVWFLLTSLLQSVRTGILSTGMMLMVASYLRYKLVALPYWIVGVAIGIATILFVPQVKEKMFYNPDSVMTVSDIIQAQNENNLNTNMRAYMWEHLLHTFYEGKEWVGSGLGSIQHYMYENFVFGGLKAVHGDYVQMQCDVGDIGLLLYLLFPLSIYLYTRKYVHKRPLDPLQVSAVLAVLSYAAVLPAMGFDNIVNYSFASHSYPFIFTGIFLAYKRQIRAQRRR